MGAISSIFCRDDDCVGKNYFFSAHEVAHR